MSIAEDGRGCDGFSAFYELINHHPSKIVTEEKVVEKIRVRLIIEGRVQGVWFRDSTRREAMGLGVSGWVKNRLDGGVEVLAEGPEEDVRRLVAWCHHGPSHARVTEVHETSEEWQGEFDSFDIVF